METIQDFDDMLILLHRNRVKYLIIGGLAFIYHVKPRYTKDMDLWIEPSKENIKRANKALAEFGSPLLLDAEKTDEILQLGIEPDRIDFFYLSPEFVLQQHGKNASMECMEMSKPAGLILTH